jgi:lipid A biosynthesis lauroyl/palmitoleoyl acyltransferase
MPHIELVVISNIQQQSNTPYMSKNASSAQAGKVQHPVFQVGFLHPRLWPTWLALGLLRCAVLLPLPVQHGIGRFIGRQFYRINKKRRRIAAINIALCFPELTESERHQLALDHFLAYGASIFDLAMSWWASPYRLRRLTTVHGLDIYQDALQRKENVILLTGHMLTIDLCGRYISALKPGVSMMKPLRNPVLNWIVYRHRQQNDNIMVYRDEGLRPVIRHLRNGRTAYIMPDEDFGSPASVFVPFFGLQSWTVTSLSVMARLGKAVVIPIFMHSLPGGKGYEVYIDPPLQDFPSGKDSEDAARMNRALESGVRKMPEMYAWTFKLFKTRPPGEASIY